MAKQRKGALLIIGGHEEKEGDRPILEEVARRVKEGNGVVTVMTVATQYPEEVGANYTRVFKELGVREVRVVDIRTREDAYNDRSVKSVQDAEVIFFTGGDQLRITSQMGDTPVYHAMLDGHTRGCAIAGTSAGAAVMSQTMLVAGPSDKSSDLSALNMAPGLGLISGIVVDSHFAERGRMGRLLGAVSQNPANIGLGIDEDTAVVVENDERFTVMGSGAVYVVDGREITYSTLSEQTSAGVISIFDVRAHVLGAGEQFDLTARRPIIRPEAKEGAG